MSDLTDLYVPLAALEAQLERVGDKLERIADALDRIVAWQERSERAALRAIDGDYPDSPA